MESALVNARIPIAKKEAATEILESLGLTTSQLINSAFDYLLETGSIPENNKRKHTDESDFESFVRRSTLEIDWDAFDPEIDYKDILISGKIADYESLA